MRKRLLAILAVVSVALAAGVMVSMVKSFRVTTTVILGADDEGSLGFSDVNGRLIFAYLTPNVPGLSIRTTAPSNVQAGLRQGGFLGFSAGHLPAIHFITIPHLALLPFLGIVPWLWWRTRKRLAPGLCPKCGYDVRASPERCSECGHVIVAPNA